MIPPDQAWFWTERWQRMEREVDEDITTGQILEFDTIEQAIEYLHTAAEEYKAETDDISKSDCMTTQ